MILIRKQVPQIWANPINQPVARLSRSDVLFLSTGRLNFFIGTPMGTYNRSVIPVTNQHQSACAGGSYSTQLGQLCPYPTILVGK